MACGGAEGREVRGHGWGQGSGDDNGEGRPDTTAAKEGSENWTRVMYLFQAAFREGKIEEEATRKAVVLIPKGEKDYRGIGLVEVMWKIVAAILNRRFTASIIYHDFLDGFRAGRGTGTATLESKLL